MIRNLLKFYLICSFPEMECFYLDFGFPLKSDDILCVWGKGSAISCSKSVFRMFRECFLFFCIFNLALQIQRYQAGSAVW
jgi:hypothetical protein